MGLADFSRAVAAVVDCAVGNNGLKAANAFSRTDCDLSPLGLHRNSL
jgi:hypothetical protein